MTHPDQSFATRIFRWIARPFKLVASALWRDTHRLAAKIVQTKARKGHAEGWLKVAIWLLLANSIHLGAILAIGAAGSVGQAVDVADALRVQSMSQWVLRLELPTAVASFLVAISSFILGALILPRLISVGVSHSLKPTSVAFWSMQASPTLLGIGVWLAALKWVIGVGGHGFAPIVVTVLAGAIAVLALNLVCRRFDHSTFVPHREPPGAQYDTDSIQRRHLLWALLTTLVFAVAIIGVLSKTGPARAIGPLGTLFLGINAWSFLVTLLVVMVPLLMDWVPAILAWALCWTCFLLLPAEIYRLSASSPTVRKNPPEDSYRSAETAFYEWLESRPGAKTAEGPIPVVLVSADGGGIRAAYWAARSLAVLNIKTGGRLAENTFVYSGVSGGSLGVATFIDATLNKKLDPQRTLTVVDEFYAKDLLSPELSRLVTVEPLRYFLGISGIEGRELAFERSIDSDWQSVAGSDSFSRPFLDVLGHRLETGVSPPVVIMNATIAETGKRLEIANIEGNEPGNPTSRYFAPWRKVVPPDLTLAQAVHLSARFPGISPPSAIYAEICDQGDRRDVNQGCARHMKHWITVVDGGYNDNSGIAPIERLLEQLTLARHKAELGIYLGTNVSSDEAKRRLQLLSRVSFHILVISNSPDVPFDPVERPSCQIAMTSDASAAFAALDNARERRAYDNIGGMNRDIQRLRMELQQQNLHERGGYDYDACTGGISPLAVPLFESAKARRCKRIGDTALLHGMAHVLPANPGFCPGPSRLQSLPLGWSLSPSARKMMQDATDSAAKQRFKEFENLNAYWMALDRGL